MRSNPPQKKGKREQSQMNTLHDWRHTKMWPTNMQQRGSSFSTHSHHLRFFADSLWKRRDEAKGVSSGGGQRGRGDCTYTSGNFCCSWDDRETRATSPPGNTTLVRQIWNNETNKRNADILISVRYQPKKRNTGLYRTSSETVHMPRQQVATLQIPHYNYYPL